MNLIEELDEFIKTTKDAREIKRALAVKLSLERQPSRKIQQLLPVSQSFISQGKNRALFDGVEALRVQYTGSTGYLKTQEKEAVIQWMRSQKYLRLQDLQIHVEKEYQVVFGSLQSYYNLFHEAKISWKKSPKKNPAKNEELVRDKKKEIEDYLADKQEAILAEKIAVFIIDECHLLWGDLEGYVWGKTDIRIEIPLKNFKEKQTYYGALDSKTKEFTVPGYKTGNSQNTIQFVEYLRQKKPNQRLLLIGDGATYHRSQEFRDYLSQINSGRKKEEGLITCLQFAPNAPEQNPVEDIWLQVKNFVRKFYHLCPSFKIVKWLERIFC